MGRFQRLVEIRRLEEELKGGELARANAKVQELTQRIAELEQQTAQGRKESLAALPQVGERLPPQTYEDFFSGQSERGKQLRRELQQARELVKAASEVWHAAHVKVRQAEHLEVKDKDRQAKQLRHRENLELDMAGIIRTQSAKR